MKKYQSFLSENFQFLEVKFSIYLNRRIFVMQRQINTAGLRVCIKNRNYSCKVVRTLFFPN